MRIRVLNRLVLSICLLSLPGWTQQVPLAAPLPMPQQPLIDGAATPSKVPDEIACLLLFRILADRPNGPAYALRAAHLGAGQFSSDQTQAIVDAANRTILAIKDMESQLLASNLPMDAKSQSARAQLGTILSTAIAGLKTRLGPDGSKLWDAFLINSVKPHVITTGTL